MRHTKTSLMALILSGFFVACGGGEADSGSTPATETETPAPAETTTETTGGGEMYTGELPEGVTAEMVQAGQALWPTAICVACHGPAGTGLPSLGPDLTDDTWLNIDGSYEQIVQNIMTGVSEPIEAAAPMPPKGGNPAITDEQVRQLAAYVYTLSR